MFKWLLVIAVVVLGYAWWRHQRQQAAREHAAERARRTSHPSPAQPGPMVRCRHCGVHLPAADAVRGGLGPYCCDEHRRLAEG